jgi:ATP/maltotriose-dependent transcriptional regulator MalT
VTTEADGLIERGRAALSACDWAVARATFERATAIAATGPALDGLGQALYWQGEYGRALPLRERAYAAYRRDGDHRAAGRVAVELAALHLWVHGNQPACEGWTGHARRMLEDTGDCVERGWLELLLASTRGSPDERARHATRAAELGRRHGDPGLEYDALGHIGLLMIQRGEIPEGMRLIDEAVAAASSGVVMDPWAAGEIYCSLFGACELLIDVRRAEAWLGALRGYVERTGELPVSGICRMHYGGLLTSAGRWQDAERELVAAIELYDRTWRGSRFEPIVRLADLRVRQGRLAEADRLLAGFEDVPEAAAPLARLRLAEGRPALATSVIERCLTRRGRGLASAPLLCLLVEADLAAGEREAAGRVARELVGLARATGQLPVDGLAALASARVSLACGDDAVEHLERALAAFVEAELPYELACTRLVLAGALAPVRPELARAEARAALESFDDLRADRDRDAAAALLRELGDRSRPRPRAAGPLTPRESEVLGLLAEGRSNAEIAARLHISLRTAEDHVSKILTKLGLANRTEAAAYALRTPADRSPA